MWWHCCANGVGYVFAGGNVASTMGTEALLGALLVLKLGFKHIPPLYD